VKSVLRVPLLEEHLPVATGFVTATARACGGDEKMEYALVLAVEEIFMRVCGLAEPGGELQMEMRDGGYCLELRLLFPAGGLEFGAFNLTARPATEGASLEDLGLYLAARFVDALRLRFEARDTAALTLIKERAYPEASGGEVPEQPAPEGDFKLIRPEPEDLKHFAEMAVARFPAEVLPDFLRRPGKGADMLRAGALEAALAVTGRGVIGGVVFWQPDGAKPVEMTGPYVLCGDVLDALVEECIRRTARTRAMGIFCRLTPQTLGARHFDVLGEGLERVEGSQLVYYRHLIDDMGRVAWCHPSLQSFLKRQYERLVLPRDLRPVKDHGERMAECSLLACDVQSSASRVTMRGLVAGRDAAANLAAHLARFEREGIRRIWFEMDLGDASQASFAPALAAAGMAPAVVIPNAGAGDLLIFQRAGG